LVWSLGLLDRVGRGCAGAISLTSLPVVSISLSDVLPAANSYHTYYSQTVNFFTLTLCPSIAKICSPGQQASCPNGLYARECSPELSSFLSATATLEPFSFTTVFRSVPVPGCITRSDVRINPPPYSDSCQSSLNEQIFVQRRSHPTISNSSSRSVSVLSLPGAFSSRCVSAPFSISS
jgi:hypothetical protein